MRKAHVVDGTMMTLAPRSRIRLFLVLFFSRHSRPSCSTLASVRGSLLLLKLCLITQSSLNVLETTKKPREGPRRDMEKGSVTGPARPPALAAALLHPINPLPHSLATPLPHAPLLLTLSPSLSLCVSTLIKQLQRARVPLRRRAGLDL